MHKKILKNMKATAIPKGDHGLWEIKKYKNNTTLNNSYKKRTGEDLQEGTYTYLLRTTLENIHLDHGECVMEDTPKELNTHLNFVLKAKGKVLITGLGLGCIVRGLLCKEEITKITVIERDKSVLSLVVPHMPKDERLNIIEADAIKWTKNNTENFDFAWHDVWNDKDNNEKPLPLIHLQLILNLINTVKRQGAWGMTRLGLTIFKKQNWWYENYGK